MQSVKSIEVRYFYLTSDVFRQMSCQAEAQGKNLVLTLPFQSEAMPIHILTTAYDKMADEHPHRDSKPKTSTETERNQKAVKDKVGEAFYVKQDAMLEGWEVGKPAPVGLVTDDGTAVKRLKGSKTHKLKPDREPHNQTSPDLWNLT